MFKWELLSPNLPSATSKTSLLEEVLTSPQFSPQNCMKITKKECVLVDTSDSPVIDYMFMFPICSCLKLFDAMLIPCDMSGGCRLRWVHRLQMTSPHQDGSFRIFWPHVCKKGGGGDVSSALMGLSQQARLVNVCSIKTPP